MFDLNALIGESRRVIIDLSGRQCSYRNLPAQRIADLRALCSQWLKADTAVDEDFEADISFIKLAFNHRNFVPGLLVPEYRAVATKNLPRLQACCHDIEVSPTADYIKDVVQKGKTEEALLAIIQRKYPELVRLVD